MAQLNINLDASMQENLRRFMRLRSIRTKSDAVRVALAEAVERESRGLVGEKYSDWLGAGCRVPPNPDARFSSEDDLWGSP